MLLPKNQAVNENANLFAALLPLAAAPACMFGTNWKKSWLFCSNRPVIQTVGVACTHDADSHLNFAGLRLPDGTFFSRLTACYPDLLANTLAQVILPFLSLQSRFFH